mgnify:CR=1 FL=1
MRDVRTLLTGLAVIIAFLQGCGETVDSPGPITDQEEFTKQIQVPPNVDVIEMHHYRGSVTVEGWDEPYILLEGEKSATARDVQSVRDLLMQLEFIAYEKPDNRLVVAYDDPLEIEDLNPFDPRAQSVYTTIHLPRNLKLELRNDGGPVRVTNLNSGLRLDQKDGNVMIRNIDDGVVVEAVNANIQARNIKPFFETYTREGELEAEYIEGYCRIEHRDGSVNLNQVDGNVMLDTNDAPANLINVNGSIEVEARDGNVVVNRFVESVKANVRNGSINLLPQNPIQGDLAIQAVNGDINVRISENSSVLFDLTAESGALESDYYLPISAESNLSKARGAIQSGEYLVNLYVERGKITVTKTRELPASSAEPATPTTSAPSPTTSSPDQQAPLDTGAEMEAVEIGGDE